MAKLLAVLAHPDDETFICGGALAKMARAGDEVLLVCATKGEMGRRMGIPPVATRESVSALREMELRSACHALGISSVYFLGLRDKTLEIQPMATLVALVFRYIQLEQPDLVLTFHEKWGGHADHCAIGAATTVAFRAYKKAATRATLMFVCSGDMIRNPAGYGLRADMLMEIDVSACMEEKLFAFRAHRTQSELTEWLWQEDKAAISHLWDTEYLLPYHLLEVSK